MTIKSLLIKSLLKIILKYLIAGAGNRDFYLISNAFLKQKMMKAMSLINRNKTLKIFKFPHLLRKNLLLLLKVAVIASSEMKVKEFMERRKHRMFQF